MIFRQLLLLPFLFVMPIKNKGLVKISSDISSKNIDARNFSTTNKNKQKFMGISISLYRVAKAEKLDDLKDLESEIAKTTDTRVNLYKITGDLLVIFLNTTEPYENINTIPYKMLYGTPCEKSISVGEIGGFLPSSEILEITKWIKKNKIETFAGFSKMYDDLSKDVKKELEEMVSDDKVALFNGYVRPLTVLYFTALENQNSILFVGQ